MLCALTWTPGYCNQLLADLLAGYPPNTTSISLTNQNLTSIPDNSFSPLPFLQNLDLSQNLIDTLGTQAFNGLTYLHHLDLSHNKIATINGQSFYDLINLGSLSLSHNMIQVLPANLFHNVASEDYHAMGLNFDLSNNEICVVHPDAFGNADLWFWHLNLDNNRISCLPDFVFSNTRIYNRFSLQNNELTLVSGKTLQMMDASTDVVDYFLSNNRISYIPANFTFMPPFLHMLDLSNNEIAAIHPQAGIDVFYYINLSNNRLTCLPEGFFSLNYYWHVDLSANQLSTIQQAVYTLSNNANLVLTSNPLQCRTICWLKLLLSSGKTTSLIKIFAISILLQVHFSNL